ncbi:MULTISPECIES: hypothetical protein [Dehalococcoides]|uniref:Uncharacterized protein n=1 Tax=Dehalococcoides mccartyi TaxID=61435 RepID=A0AB38ZAG8_9CHLR|nr:hypothetical protein [Dehalococcoides mccartyi]OBW61888.1 MAG: hypothetical protein A9181_02600 [Dehalococcoides mccartyi]WRO07574.1 hypothetical protein VLL09_01390 [Dehalococcoides mccartyi]
MTDISIAVSKGIEEVVLDFQAHPHNYFTEEDVRWRLLREIGNILALNGTEQFTFLNGVTSIIHTEYPTPFRCSMIDRQFKLLDVSDIKGQRGHFDIVILNRKAASQCEFEVLRSQDYKTLCENLKSGKIPLPVLDYAIELKLFRDLAHRNRTESAKQQAEYAVQAIRKLEATVQANDYYPKPFADHGIVLLFDNSELASTSNIEIAQNKFWDRFKELVDWNSLSPRLSCIWASPRKKEEFQGQRTIE